LDETHEHLGPEPRLVHEDGKGILAGGADARVPLTETAHVLHGSLCRPVDLALLLLIRRQQENEDDEPKDGSNEKHRSAPFSSSFRSVPGAALPLSWRHYSVEAIIDFHYRVSISPRKYL